MSDGDMCFRKKIMQGRRQGMLSMEETGVLSGAVTEGFSEKVTFQQSSKENEAMTHTVPWGKSFSKTAKCAKALK